VRSRLGVATSDGPSRRCSWAANYAVSDFLLNLGRSCGAQCAIERIETYATASPQRRLMGEPSEQASRTLTLSDRDQRSPAIGPYFGRHQLTYLQREN